MKEDPSQFAVPEAIVEAFEPLEFVDHLGGYAATTGSRDDRERIREQPEHALRFKASFEGAHRVSGWVPVSWARCLAVRS